jgi:hypothetical protein
MDAAKDAAANGWSRLPAAVGSALGFQVVGNHLRMKSGLVNCIFGNELKFNRDEFPAQLHHLFCEKLGNLVFWTTDITGEGWMIEPYRIAS